MKIQTKYRQINENFVLKKSELFHQLYEQEPHSAAPGIPLIWNRATGFSVYDDAGNQWIDMTSGIFVANAGHANPAIKTAIREQLDKDMLFAYNYPTTIKRDFIAKLLDLSPPHFNKVALLNSGSEAMDLAYKLVKLWGKKKNRRYVITLDGSYHGRGLSNDLICGSKEKANWSGVADNSVVFMDFPYKETDQFDFSQLPSPNQISAFFLETFQGWGAWFYPPQYICDLHHFAKDNDILICFDEMQAGFYRLGPLYGYMTYGDLMPDIICLGKGITSSLPLSAVLTRAEIMDVDEKADLHGTHSGNPLCCAAGLANLEFLSDPDQVQKRKITMNTFEEEVSSLRLLPIVKQVNVRGMIAGLIFDDADTATEVAQKCITNGVLPVCTFKNSIKLAPPLTIIPEAVKEALGVIREVIVHIS